MNGPLTTTGLTVNGTCVMSSAFLFPITVQTTNYAVQSGDVAIVMDGLLLTVTLPASPTHGRTLFVRNSAVSLVTVARNGSNINGAAANLSLATGPITLCYHQPDNSWWVVS